MIKQSENQRSKVVFLGSGRYVLPILEILNRNFNITVALTTEKDKDRSVSNFCKKNNIFFLFIHKFNNEAISAIKQSDAEIGILANFGIIVPANILNLFPFGIVNVHPSLLPKYRGSTPVQTAILNGDKTTGVTLIKLDNEVDHGPILAQKSEPILPDDTAESLYKKLFKIGADLIRENLKKYLDGQIKPKEQDHSKATFTKILAKNDGYFDINKSLSADTLNRMIRAYHSWPGVWFKYHSERSEESRLQNKILKLLPENKIQVEGKKPMSYEDFINGYPQGKNILEKLGLIKTNC